MRLVTWAMVACALAGSGCKRDRPLPKEISEAPPEMREPVRKALETGKLEVSPRIRQAAEDTPVEEDGIMLEGPVSTFVSSTTPTLRWRRDERLKLYQARVWEAGGKPAAESPWLEAGEWKCEPPLTPGVKYQWQVAGKGRRSEMLSAKASFTVPEPDALERMAKARERLAGNDLALAVLYAREGAVDEAQRLLAGYIVRHPTSEEAKKLYKSLRAQRVELTKK
jgi:hypothetical protein